MTLRRIVVPAGVLLAGGCGTTVAATPAGRLDAEG
jgi:hypothetical protein